MSAATVTGGEPTAKDLAQACRDGKADAVRDFLARGIGVNDHVEFGGTSLVHAAVSGQEAIVKLLLDEAGADINAATDGKSTALMLASEKGLTAIVKCLLERKPNLEAVDRHGRSAVHIAAIAGKHATLALLLEAGAKVNALDTDGNTPLMLAARYGKLDAAKALVAAGADFKATNAAGHTAADCARHGKSKEVEDFIIDAELDAEEA